MDARVRHADPARPAHLQAEAALREVRGARGLLLLPLGDGGSRTQRAKREERAGPTREEPAMNDDHFQSLVAEAIDGIPKRFRRHIKNVAIVVEDEPAPDLLEDMEIEPPDTLYGLYQGTPMTERSWGHGNALPDRIVLFKGPLERDSEDEDDLVVAIGETLIHEVGHYFGLSEAEIEEIEEKYWRGEPDPDDARD
jgi:predicted Zn-dependent protease with MMP-like domain